MTAYLTGAAAFLVANVALGLIRVMRGPSPADRMLAAQLFGTTGVAVLLLLSRAMDEPALVDTALVFVLLAAVLSVAFVKRGWVRVQEESGDEVAEKNQDVAGDGGPG